jgi:hypothetical protein
VFADDPRSVVAGVPGPPVGFGEADGVAVTALHVQAAPGVRNTRAGFEAGDVVEVAAVSTQERFEDHSAPST